MTLACVLATALGYALSGGVVNWWPLAWLAPLPILWLALHVTRQRAAQAAFVAYTLGQVGKLPILLAIVPAKVAIVATIASALLFAVIIIAARAVALSLDLRLYALAFPLFWTAWEELLVKPIGGGGELGFSQVDFLPLAQLASITGVVGVSFVVAFAPSLTATLLALRERGLPWRRLAIFGGGAIAGVIAFGAFRLARPPDVEPARIGMAVSDEHVERSHTNDADVALEVVGAYVRRTHDLADRGAQVVVTPEKFVGVTSAYADQVDDRLARAAESNHVWLIAGLNRIGLAKPRNVAAVFTPDGSKALEYDKIHLVPGYEDAYAAGDQLGTLPTAPGPWAVAVCRDLIVPELAPQLSLAGAKIVFAPAWDFVADGPLESRVARMRAIEGGFALARAAKEGVVTVSDGFGRALLAVPTSSTAEVLDVVSVSPGPGATFYSRMGNCFGRACVAAAALLLILAAVRARRDRALRH